MDLNKLRSDVLHADNKSHDKYILYELNNELGYKLEVAKIDNTVYLTLMSKNGDLLSTVHFDVGSGSGGGGATLMSVALDHEGLRLLFVDSESKLLQCDLSLLYGSKQDIIPDLSLIRINAATAMSTLNKKLASWDAKSVVTASETGTSYKRIKFITIDDTEYKIDFDESEVQAKLTPGENITITDDNVISSRNYTAGTGISIDQDEHVISLDEASQDYNILLNKPQINGVTLIGNLLGVDLKLDIVDYILYRDYLNLPTKERKLYFVCKTTKDIQAENCWRIYLQNKLIGEWEIESGSVTLPIFPMRFPFRFA